MITKHRSSILIIALAIAFLPAPLPRAAAQDAPSIQSELRGMFYNQRTKSGGPATVALQVDGDELRGTMNVTEFPGASQKHCGAGAFTASRAATPLSFTFVSRDEDSGCGYDRGAEFTVTASLDREATHLWGEFSIENANESIMSTDTGIFEVWTPGAEPPTQTYTGTFHNVTRELDGVLSLTLIEGAQLISGSIDFDNHPGEQTLCGGGPFVGISEQPLMFTTTSRDNDPGCGLPAGFEVTATPSPDRETITGTFRVGSEQGTFSVGRVSPAALRSIAATTTVPIRNVSIAQPLPAGMFTVPVLIVTALAVTGVLWALIFRLLIPRKRAPARVRPTTPPPAQPATTPPSAQPAAPNTDRGGALPYARIPQLLTAAERTFYEALLQATPRHLAVFPQIRLANLVKTTARHPKQQQYDFYRIQAKCVDFVLCDARSTAPRLVIELDDSSHQLQHRQKRDAFVDAVLAAVGLPILHVHWLPHYDPARLAEQIRTALGESPAATPVTVLQTPSSAAPAPAASPTPRSATGPAAGPPPPAATPLISSTYACGQCQREVRRDAKYCPHCSAALGERT